jgi:hypothetical protein
MITKSQPTAFWQRARLMAYSLCLAFSPGHTASDAHAQDYLSCGNLYLRVSPDSDHRISTSGSWFLFQVFRRSGGDESPLLTDLPYTPYKPSARCIGGSVLMIAFFPPGDDPAAELVFQNGHHQLELLIPGDFEIRDDAMVIPARPRLPPQTRERIPAEYRDLFDYSRP